MPSSYTDIGQLELQFTGENVNVWGDRLNTVITNLSLMISGMTTVALTGDYTLTSGNTGSNEARYGILKFTGGAGPYTVTIRQAQKTYLIWNATSGTVTITTGAGTTVQVATTDIVTVFCDGTNVKTPGYGGASLKDYIASVVVGGGASLPSLVGNAGKWLTNNGSIASWALPTISDISDYTSDQAIKTTAATARAIAFAVTL